MPAGHAHCPDTFADSLWDSGNGSEAWGGVPHHLNPSPRDDAEGPRTQFEPCGSTNLWTLFPQMRTIVYAHFLFLMMLSLMFPFLQPTCL